MYVLSLLALVAVAVHGLTDSVTVLGESASPRVIILDAGHGGPDGGSSAADGTRESDLNLEIVLRLEDLLSLLGQPTLLVRETDTDLSDASAATIAQKKVSDIRNRVSLANATEDGLLVSIHQNTYSEEKYSGAQVFYSPTGDSQALAEALQSSLQAHVDPENHRKAKEISQNVYLMRHITIPGVLVECGFLSNPQEAAKLKTDDYQKQLAVALGVSLVNYLSAENTDV
jgi:N-acetylmuramoyl-L-alanine amidase